MKKNQKKLQQIDEEKSLKQKQRLNTESYVLTVMQKTMYRKD